MRLQLATCFVLLLSLACGSDDDEAEEVDAAAAEERSDDSGAERAATEQDLWAAWPAGTPRAAAGAASTAQASRATPDAVLARFESECAANAGTPECQALRRAVERLYLSDLLGLRGAFQPIDPGMYRTAARAETPQLACIGLRELMRSPSPSAEDEALLAAALDSPWRGPRTLVLALANPPWGARPRFSVLARRTERAVEGGYQGLYDICIDGSRDPEPNPGLAGRYPGARHRPFASDATRRWFTTPDPPKQVLAYLTKGGGAALTADEMKAAQTAKYMQQMLELSSGNEPVADANLTERMLQLVLEQGVDWSASFKGLQGTGEIRYVMITPKQAVAVFRDEILDATSIVAPRPAPPMSASVDMDAAKREAFARSVFGF